MISQPETQGSCGTRKVSQETVWYRTQTPPLLRGLFLYPFTEDHHAIIALQYTDKNHSSASGQASLASWVSATSNISTD